jgi:hypothetical protein
VDVHRPASLVLNDLRVGDSYDLLECIDRYPLKARHHPSQIDDRAPPELPNEGVPDHGRLVVVATMTEGLTDKVVFRFVGARAISTPTVFAELLDRSRPAWKLTGILRTHPMHRSEARCRQGGEHRWTQGDLDRHTLPAVETCSHELPRIAPVNLCARATECRSPRAARLE